MLCDVSREGLNILNTEFLRLNGVLYVLRGSLNSLVIIWHNIVYMLVKECLLFLLRKMVEVLKLFLKRLWQTLIRTLLVGKFRQRIRFRAVFVLDRRVDLNSLWVFAAR